MFWSGNYIAVRELNFLLKEENVSLTQVLEADDILQECKADNKALIQFLTKPEILAELITLITEEPPKNVELASQYRHASIACEVLTSHLSTLADRLSLDTVQMNRLCDFINRDPPLNPLLASYFSKTVEMLLERSPKQDWYLYHIVCLRVLDFFRSRRDFLPNLLRHMATSAVADTFKFLLRLDDLFNKIVMEWLDEHQFLECLIQIICGTYSPPPPHPSTTPASAPAHNQGETANEAGQKEKSEVETENPELNHKEANTDKEHEPLENNQPETSKELEETRETVNDTVAANEVSHSAADSDSSDSDSERWRAVAAANAAALLCDLILNGCAGEGCTTRLRTVWVLVTRLQSEEWVRALLAGMFTSSARARPRALVHGCQVLLALLSADPLLAGQCAAERTSVELAVAPHLPLLHQALLQDNPTTDEQDGSGSGAGKVGAARVHVAALLAQLASSEVEHVPTTIITLGTPGTLVDLFFRYPNNNFLHAQVYALIKHALNNRAYSTQYANHLIIECDLLTRLMDAFEENENITPRAGYMGHVILALRRAARALDERDGMLSHSLALADSILARWAAFTRDKLAPLAHQHDTPLGGYYPSENIYEVDNMPDLAENMEASYEFNDMTGNALDLPDEINVHTGNEFGNEPTQGGDAGLDHNPEATLAGFLKLVDQRRPTFDADMWDDLPEEEGEEDTREEGEGARDSPTRFLFEGDTPPAWESNPDNGGTSSADDDWAQFSAAPVPPPVDPFAPIIGAAEPQDFAPFWPSSDSTSDIPEDIMALSKFSISDTFPEQMTRNLMDNEPKASSTEVSQTKSDTLHGQMTQNLMDNDPKVSHNVVSDTVSETFPKQMTQNLMDNASSTEFSQTAKSETFHDQITQNLDSESKTSNNDNSQAKSDADNDNVSNDNTNNDNVTVNDLPTPVDSDKTHADS